MEKEGVAHEFLSFEHVPETIVRAHFPNIYSRCLEEGYDLLKEPIPIVPAQHYFMGGVHVRNVIPRRQWRICTQWERRAATVSTENRLASNSLLESLVFAKRAAEKIMKERTDYESNYNAACC